MKITESEQYKIHKLQEMIQCQAWKLYEEFINDYICRYIASSVPRDQLIGMKTAIESVKKYIEHTN